MSGSWRELRARIERQTAEIARLTKLEADNKRVKAAIHRTASEGTYDEMAIRKAVSFELAELIVAARAALGSQNHESF